jgi:hypothetical protein
MQTSLATYAMVLKDLHKNNKPLHRVCTCNQMQYLARNINVKCMQASPDTRAVILREVDKKINKLLAHYAIILPQAHLTASSIRLLVEHKDNKVISEVQALCCTHSVSNIFDAGRGDPDVVCCH